MTPPLREPSTRQFDGVLLDLFGTLIPNGGHRDRARSVERMALALRVDPAEFARRWSSTFDERARGAFGPLEQTISHLATATGRRPSAEELGAAVAIRLDFSRSLLVSSDHTLRGLDALRAAGCRLALVSDCTEETPWLWPSSGLHTRFDTVVFSCVEGVRKPDPRIYRLALERLGLDPPRCAFVGDGGSRELTGAERVGLFAFRYNFPGLEAATADRVDYDEEWSGPTLKELRDLLIPGP
jgi:putative hydrolase of the HAD superfamily